MTHLQITHEACVMTHVHTSCIHMCDMTRVQIWATAVRHVPYPLTHVQITHES